MAARVVCTSEICQPNVVARVCKGDRNAIARGGILSAWPVQIWRRVHEKEGTRAKDSML